MPEGAAPKSRTGPKVLITLSAVGFLLGLGRCGFLAPMVKPVDDYGISGACCVIVSMAMLIGGMAWLSRIRSKGNQQR